jgi:hypothetical protein
MNYRVTLLLLPRLSRGRDTQTKRSAGTSRRTVPRRLRCYLPLSLSFEVSADEVDDDELGDAILPLDVLLVLSDEPVAPGVVPLLEVPDVPDVPEVPDIDELPDDDGVVLDDEGVVVVVELDDGGVDGLIVPVDELELVSGVVVLGVVVVVVELELVDAGGVVGVLVLFSRLHPTRPIAAAMATTASGFAFIRNPPKRFEGREPCDRSFSRINAMHAPDCAACTGSREPVQGEGIRQAVVPRRHRLA